MSLEKFYQKAGAYLAGAKAQPQVAALAWAV